MEDRSLTRFMIISLVLIAVPFALFPDRFGSGLGAVSPVTLVIEFLVYGGMLFLFNTQATFMNLVSAAAICLCYRLALGAVFAVLCAVVYGMQFTNALTLGLGAYIPALIIQGIATPFVLRTQVWEWLGVRVRRNAHRAPEPVASTHDAGGRTTFVTARGQATRPASTFATSPQFNLQESRESAGPQPPAPDMFYQGVSQSSDTNGFDRAVRYVCEDASVRLAAVVDTEGLLLAHCKRGKVEPELWAPFAVELMARNNSVLSRGGWDSAEKLELLLRDDRVVIARDGESCLLVVADRHTDDVLNIRIAQALEMIRKYTSDRYSDKPSPTTERYHVQRVE